MCRCLPYGGESLNSDQPHAETSDSLPFDLVRIVEAFERHDVAYIAIGGISGMLHGAVNYVTQDVDMMVRAVDENLARVIAALNDLGVDTDHELAIAELRQNTRWTTEAGPLDILLTAIGPHESEITFTDLTPGTQLFEITQGLLVRAASLNDVIRMKEAADRLKDHLALPELRRLRGDAHPERQRDEDLFAEFNIEEGLDD